MLIYFSKNYFLRLFLPLIKQHQFFPCLSSIIYTKNTNTVTVGVIENQQETEKVKALHSQLEQEHTKKSTLLSEVSLQSSEVAHLKAREVQLIKEVTHLREAKRKFEDDIVKIRNAHNVDVLQMKEIQDQLEAEQYFSRLYKTQSLELREENEEKCRNLQELEEERGSLVHQLQIAIARADSEALARSIAEETVADLEKDKTMKELELKDMLTKHRNEIAAKETALTILKDSETEITKKLNNKLSELEDVIQANKKLMDEVKQCKIDEAEMDKMKTKLKNETILKQQAVNKLAEIVNRKDFANTGKTKKVGSAADLRKKEKEAKRLQQELTQEKDKYNNLLTKFHDVHSQLTEEQQARTKLQMEIQCKATEIEQLQAKLNDTASLSSADNDTEDSNQDSVFEGWLSTPIKQNIRRHGWKKQYVVVSSRRIIFYNTEVDKQNTSDPVLILDLR